MKVMSTIPHGRKLVAAAALGWLTVACLGGSQPARPAPAADERPALHPYYFASRQGCGRAGCHASPPTRDDEYVCRCDEYTRWADHDKHAGAGRVLSGPRGQQMAKLLGYDVTRAEACLACHSAVIKDPESRDPKFAAESEGVSCVVCHGAYKDWYEPHGSYLQADKWRKLSRAEKERRYGMTDLWDPARRTAVCASCHVGNLGEGKFVTHEMYAAGHPPLPGFEPATFCEKMPRHWQLPREKSARVREMLGLDAKGYDQTRLVLVGAAVTLRERMRLLAAQSAACVKADDPDGRLLDYASFDCAACHHNLRSPSWRQRRGFAGAPGRVPPASWPLALTDPVLRWMFVEEHADRPQKALRRHQEQLDAALRARPYGDPAQVGPAAEAFAQLADELAAAAGRKALDEVGAAGALTALPVLAAGQVSDYDSARQIAWAVGVVYRERQQVEKKAPDPRTEQALAALEARLKDRAAYDPERCRQSFAELESSFREATNPRRPEGGR
jgi:hypothetical protein